VNAAAQGAVADAIEAAAPDVIEAAKKASAPFAVPVGAVLAAVGGSGQRMTE
jgi:hypothetical protein